MHYDVFNGDADGICALIQLRLDQPVESTLITGTKRDIQLLDNISPQPGDSITVLDISFKKNNQRVVEFLAAGATIFYVDHHQSGDIPVHPNLSTLIDTDSAVCTSLLVNKYLKGKYPLWAITAAYGDNLQASADKLVTSLNLNADQQAVLKNFGIYLNYNSYGLSVSDLHFAPDKLCKAMMPYQSPIDFIADNPEISTKLADGYQQDMAKAKATTPEFQTDAVAVYVFPDEVWARRVTGVFGNDLSNQDPNKAYAVLCPNQNAGFLVSVRSPIGSSAGADGFCAGFVTGGGRKSAAGINHLPESQLSEFVRRFDAFYGSG